MDRLPFLFLRVMLNAGIALSDREWNAKWPDRALLRGFLSPLFVITAIPLKKIPPPRSFEPTLNHIKSNPPAR